MTGEMEKADKSFGGQNKPNPYVKLLLANLNLADRYVRLQKRYDELLNAHEAFKIRPGDPVVDASASPESTPVKFDEEKPPACQDDDIPALTLEFESCDASLPIPESKDIHRLAVAREKPDKKKMQLPRITSYNVCYTKLLRLFQGIKDLGHQRPGGGW